LDSLSLSGATDETLRHIAELKSLETLELVDSALGENGLLPLIELPRLAQIRLRGRLGSSEALARFQERRPDVLVER
jgi:hypothetical protein